MSLEIAIFLLPGLVVGLSLHEFAHAWSASLLGDNFARRQGRVSLNPFRHLSILGTLAIFFLPIGWGKPVQINLYNFKHPKRDYLISSLAGPLANVVIVICCIGLAQLTRHDYSYGDSAQPFVALGHYLLVFTASINTVLATINLLPIPPLDGSKIWPCLIPGLKPSFGAKGIWVFIFAIMFLVHTGTLDPVFDFAINSTDRYMPAPDSSIYREYRDGGRIAYEAEKYEIAEELLTEALRYNPRGRDALQWRASTRLELGKLTEALADVDRVIELWGRKSEFSEVRDTCIQLRETILKLRERSTSRPASQPASRPRSPDQASPVDKSSDDLPSQLKLPDSNATIDA